jgi:glutamate-ammonia-ligase adenylyltransferase
MANDPEARELLADILEDFLGCAAESANPDQALNYLEQFSEASLNKVRLFSSLKDEPLTLDILARTLGCSPYLAEILIRNPQHFYWVTDPAILRNRRGKRAIQRELLQTLKALDDEAAQLDYLRFFKRREMLHIGLRDLLRICTVGDTLCALSELAEALVSAVYWVCARVVRRECGIPPGAATGFTIVALGKLGGAELNFSSDVDLLYVYDSSDERTVSVNAGEYFERLSQRITKGLSELTSEGYIYRVDLGLRPGDRGGIACSIDSFRGHCQFGAGAWERLTLLKARPVAGSATLGMLFLTMAREFIFDAPFDAAAVKEIRSIKEKIDHQLATQGQTRNVKLGTGGIREIEFILQTLQVKHGILIPEIRQRGTLHALDALRDHGLIGADDAQMLSSAYVFLRDVENKLQMVNDAQTHSLPREVEELTGCARMLGYARREDFLHDYEHYTADVRRIFERSFSI